jgi:hypothetical protein
MKKQIRKKKGVGKAILLACVLITLASVIAAADPHVGQSSNVVMIGGPNVASGGTLPTSGPAGGLGDFTFTSMAPGSVSLANLAGYDTVVLNVASTQMACDANTLSATAKADLNTFVANGGKMIIYDSECNFGGSVDYSWLSYPFTTTNPGPIGYPGGTLTIVEDNVLSHNTITNPHYIDTAAITSQTDAVSDMNVVDLTSVDPHWGLDMTGTNYLGDSGAVHICARSGTGLYIYNGLDMDYIVSAVGPSGGGQLAKTWLQELQAPMSGQDAPICGIPPIGIALIPGSATNMVGEDHMVTATLTDLFGIPKVGVLVTFEVTSGPNAGTTGTCSTNADCTSDANGQVSFTFTGDAGVGTDVIVACFINDAGAKKCSVEVEKEWTTPPYIEVPVDVKPTSCRNPLNVNDNGVLPVAILGTSSFDATKVDINTVRLETVSPLRSALEDVATPFVPYTGKKAPFDCTTAGPDGYIDLTLKFDAQSVIAALGTVADGDVKVLHVTGKQIGGTDIIGEDVVVILKKK